MVTTARETKIKPGYKQTEVGVIPEEWEAKKLGEVIMLQRGYDLPHKERKYGTVPIVSSSGIIDTHNESRASGPGVVTGRYGTIGEIFFVEEDFWPLNTTLFVKDFKKNNPLFISFLLRTIDYQSYSGKSGVPGVNRNDLHEIGVSLPPLSEQQAIATALSDVDALLTSLDKLIAKKRDIKQATMQQLLTGKMRLPGFSGEWKVVKLEDVADKNVQWSITGGPFGSNLKTVDYVTEGVRIIQLQNIGDGFFHDNYKIYTSEEKADELISCNIYPGEIILSKMGDPVARACIVPDGAYRYVMASDGIRLVVDKKQFDTVFIHDYINSIYFRKKAIEASTGSTRQRIGLEDLKKLPTIAPSLAEQQAIAAVLSDMDAEIVALEQRREKTCALKQGMMQELLTGKTRLL